ncbi:MAG: hypothetical protein IK097_03275 [Clostridia bacterium]|nr:hypothetical protein [Clostridia bacterium]
MKSIRKAVCTLLSAIIVFSAFFCLPFSADAYGGNVPIIFIHGQGSSLGIKQEDGSYQRIKGDDMALDGNALIDVLKDNYEILLKAIVTQDWSDFCKMVEDYMISQFSEVALGTDGMPVDGSESTVNYTEDYVRYRYLYGDSSLNKFWFVYDWRLDPTDNMERLHDYAETILRVTGCEKYAVAGRCEGACLALTYWETYHDERMTDLIFYASAAKGAMPIGESFSGNLHIDPDAVERSAYETDLGVNIQLGDNMTITDETIRDILRIISDFYGLDYACWAVNNVYEQIEETITPAALKKTLATFPGFWAMCDDEYYEQAKEIMFGGEEETYSAFIAKIDNYHYNIMNRADEIIQNAKDSGVRVSDIVKYGFQSYPITKHSEIQSDTIVRVDKAGFGVTGSEIGKILSDSCIRDSFSNGNSKYISPDLTIDASTGLLKDSTWFIKNLTHGNFPTCVDDLIYHIVNTETLDAVSDKEYPQYLFYDEDEDTIAPLVSTEKQTKLDEFNANNAKNFMRVIKPVFRAVYQVVVFITKIFTSHARA